MVKINTKKREGGRRFADLALKDDQGKETSP